MARNGNGSGDVYYPSDEVLAQAHIKDRDAVSTEMQEDLAGAWGRIAHEEFEWSKPWDTTLDESDAPFYKWFVGGKTNIVTNALDRHQKSWRRNKAALIWEGENYEQRTYTYQQLHREVSRFASVLRAMGVKKGDRVTIYMGRIPEIVIAMLACAKIGAVHSVVYGGFSVEALHGRIEDSQSTVAITADGSWLRGNVVPLKDIMDEALQRAPTVQTVIVVKRTGQDVHMEPGRDLWYHDLMNLPIADPHIETVQVDAEDPLYLLYTSGTTGKPKAILHTHGGYMVGVATTLKWVFDLKDDDTWWCAADPGWVTGHSYIVYGPLLLGMTSVIYEGGPNYPFPNRWWDIVERHGITVMYTAPTAIRGLMRFGDAWPNRHDLSTLRLLGSVGEPINPEAWRWYYRVIGKERCPIMDTWWQTETGHFMITPLPCTPLKPGSASLPFPGVEVDVLDEEGNPAAPNEEGYLVIKRPWPGMMRTIYGDPDRYVQNYWTRFPGMYMTGDSARRDEDGYIWVIGRVDDVIKVSGYRLGTAEIESALVSHPSVAEA
ncbi:MAG TPA: acetate--CoA ligase, partial [Aggregatilinea sp.]|uniref:acetate--CoA ligase n=1 Tax=Aggregatilinea sp. TaxID=2806333 RepID=UPI002BCFA687